MGCFSFDHHSSLIGRGLDSYNFAQIHFQTPEKKPGWWFQIVFIFTPTWGNDPIWLAHIFQMGWFNHQLETFESASFSSLAPPTLRRPPRLLKDWTNLREARARTGDGEKLSLKEQQKKWQGRGCAVLGLKVALQNNIWVVVWNIFYVHPYLGKWSNLTNIFQMSWNHQLEKQWTTPLKFKVSPLEKWRDRKTILSYYEGQFSRASC